jgi:hypothetical protein
MCGEPTRCAVYRLLRGSVYCGGRPGWLSYVLHCPREDLTPSSPGLLAAARAVYPLPCSRRSLKRYPITSAAVGAVARTACLVPNIPPRIPSIPSVPSTARPVLSTATPAPVLSPAPSWWTARSHCSVVTMSYGIASSSRSTAPNPLS